ncbi:MAG: hypothetical protein EBX19_06980 [Actinobacteria bacterium]|nr:hypothetical protein [Actinomycetota bacterium]
MLIMLLSLLVGIGTYSYLLTYQSRVESENSLSSVYVAKQEIPQGTSLAEIKDQTLLEIRRLPLKALPIDALTPNSLKSDLRFRRVCWQLQYPSMMWPE